MMTFNLTPSRTRSNDSVKRNKFSKSEDSGSSVQKLTPFQADTNTILRLRRELSRKLEGIKTFIDNPLNKTDRQTKKSSTKLQRNNQKTANRVDGPADEIFCRSTRREKLFMNI